MKRIFDKIKTINFKKLFHFSFIKNNVLRIIIKSFVLVLVLILLFKFFLFIVPFPELKKFRNKPYSLAIFDRNNNLLRIFPLENGIKREFCSLKNIPDLVKNIFITSEDKRFYFHPGIDIFSIIRSIILNLQEKRHVSGASTITMQLARIISPHDGGYKGKIIEILDAFRIEGKLSKKQILELYLNSIPFGKQAVGIESASKTYFGKKLNELEPSQLLSLAVIMRRPEKYDPFKNQEALKKAVIKLSEKIEYDITENEIKRGIESAKKYNWVYEAPHFVNFIQNNLDKNSFKNGKPIVSSLDLELNYLIQDKINIFLEIYKENRLRNGAVLVIDNNTGEILAYIGSQGFDDINNSGQIDGVHVLNQPGSTLKPFLYGLALENGFLPNTILPDIPLDFGSEKIYIPMNFDNRFNGPVRFRVALASSLNVTAVYLITRLGVKNFSDKLIELGFDSIRDQQDYLGSGLAVGNAEVSLYELTRAFSVFPRGGKSHKLTFLKNEGCYYKGKKIYSEYASSIICNILSDDTSRRLGFGNRSGLNTTFPAMFKTGTSDQFGNIWALGATPDYTVGVWIGNFSGETIIGRTGSSLPAAVAVHVLKFLTKENKDFFMTKDIQQIPICTLSGKLVTDACPGSVYEYFPYGESVGVCDYHYYENNDVKVKYPAEFANWVHNYKEDERQNFTDVDIDFPRIIRPKNRAIYYYDPTFNPEDQVVKIEILNNDYNEKLRIFINNRFHNELSYPYELYLPLKVGIWDVEVIGSGGTDRITFTVK